MTLEDGKPLKVRCPYPNDELPGVDRDIRLHFDASGMGHMWWISVADVAVWFHNAAFEPPMTMDMARLVRSLVGWGETLVEPSSYEEFRKAFAGLEDRTHRPDAVVDSTS